MNPSQSEERKMLSLEVAASVAKGRRGKRGGQK